MQEITKITSRDNARLVRARKVRDGRTDELIFVEGRRLVEEALRSQLAIEEGFVGEEFADRGLVERIADAGAIVYELPSRLMGSIADTNNTQGVILLAKRPSTDVEPFRSDQADGAIPLYIYLKEANNPSNLGAIVRTAEGAGALGIVLSPRSADPFSAKALRASMGSAFRLPVWENMELKDAVGLAKTRNLRVIAADVSAHQDHSATDWAVPTLLVLGSEAHGLTPDDLSVVDERVKIDLANGVESLNLAVAAGVLMFEMRRQIMSASKV